MGSSGLQPAWMTGALSVIILLFAVCIVLWAMLRYRVAGLSSEILSKQGDLTQLATEFAAQTLLAGQVAVDLEELRKRVLDREEAAQSAAIGWTGSGLPLNLNRRGQILRLSRKGKSVAEIASDLNVAQGEVALFLKVCDLSASTSSSGK